MNWEGNIYKFLMRVVPIVLLCLTLCSCIQEKQKLFNGKSFDGWNGSRELFRVENGMIIGGSLKKTIAQSEYLCTNQKYKNFHLTVQAKLIANQDNENAGIFFRSERIPNSNNVKGYQADIGFAPLRLIKLLTKENIENISDRFPLWGSLLDEYRPDSTRYPNANIPAKFLAVADTRQVIQILNEKDWNKIEVITQGDNIELKLNEKTTIKYVELGLVGQTGCICLQVYKGSPYEVWYKDIELIVDKD